MELNVPNPHAFAVHEQLGVSKERCIELEGFMDAVTPPPGELINISKQMERLASFCNTMEEYTICCISHCDFLIRQCGLYVRPQTQTPN